MSRQVTTLGFDADDTLWQNEEFYRLTQQRFADLLADYAEQDHLDERLLAAERRNIGHYGFGIKGFVLSMIETALEVTENRVPGKVIAELLDAGQEMLRHPIHLLPHVAETIEELSGNFRMVLITKGDLLDQERKLAQSGLGDWFDAVEIVSEKTSATYLRAFENHGDGPSQAAMVGNSLKSDVVPALDAGAWAIYIPTNLTWALEHADKPEQHPRFQEIQDMSALPSVLSELARA